MDPLLDLSRLTIAAHAYDRARERLRVDAEAFRRWVEATSGEWFPVSAPFFKARGLLCASDKRLYHCPWTPSRHLCLPVSDDCALVTVMDYEAPRDQRPDTGPLAAALNAARSWEGQYRALLKDRQTAEMAPGVPRPADMVGQVAHRLVAESELFRSGVVNHVLAEAGLDAAGWGLPWVQRVAKLYAEDLIGYPGLLMLLRNPGRNALLSGIRAEYQRGKRAASA